MSATAWFLVVAAVGYAFGRARLWRRLSDATESRVRFQPASVGYGWFVLFALTHPRRSWSGWRHRNDPPSPPVAVNLDFFTPSVGE